MLRSVTSLCLLLAAPLLRAQETHSTSELSRMAGCTLQGRTYTCSKADLKRALSLASTLKLVSAPANHASDAALLDLARSLGKTPASDTSSDTATELTFILEPLQSAGVEVGAGSVDLARLRVLLPPVDGQPGKLLWVQTYNGDPSMVWAATARATAAALRDQLRSK